MESANQQQVALFVDFENLIYGIREECGDEYESQIDPEVLFRLAQEYGQVVLANAYADWRFREVNQYQADLYRVGMDLIHVFGKHQSNRFKNAVDVKMAVDAIETLFILSHISVFVIVSGDRDFIHVLKTLRRHGKTVIGISPESSVSEDFAALCDRFVRYRALANAYNAEASADGVITSTETTIKSLDQVRQAVAELLVENPRGLKGAQVKPSLRRKIGSTFDESEYGFSRLTDLLLALPDVVRVVPNPNGGDTTIVPAPVLPLTVDTVASPEPTIDLVTRLKQQAKLAGYKFIQNLDLRRRTLQAFYEVMQGDVFFTWDHIFERLQTEHEELGLTNASLSKHFAVLWQCSLFAVAPNQQDCSTRERLMRLIPSIGSLEDFIFRYEAGIVYKLDQASKDASIEFDATIVGDILGIAPKDRSNDYCTRLITHARTLQRTGGK